LSEIAGYEIYYFIEGTPEGQGEVIIINSGNITSHTITLDSPGAYVFAISTKDTSNVLSEISTPATLIIE
jgi:hypothetical protein